MKFLESEVAHRPHDRVVDGGVQDVMRGVPKSCPEMQQGNPRTQNDNVDFPKTCSGDKTTPARASPP